MSIQKHTHLTHSHAVTHFKGIHKPSSDNMIFLWNSSTLPFSHHFYSYKVVSLLCTLCFQYSSRTRFISMESRVFPLIFSSHVPILKNSFARSVPSQTTEKFNCGKSLCSLVPFIITPKSAIFQIAFAEYGIVQLPIHGLTATIFRVETTQKATHCRNTETENWNFNAVELKTFDCTNLTITPNSFSSFHTNGFGGIGVACWLLVPKFAGSNPGRSLRNFRAKKS